MRVLILGVCSQLLYSLNHYAGDERIKQFILDLVAGQAKDYTNHMGKSLEPYIPLTLILT